MSNVVNAGSAVSVLIAVCAALATTLKAPAADASPVYQMLYTVINTIACNFGQAVNKGK